KSLMSKPDRVVDLDLPLAEIKNRTDADLQSMRPPSRGLILLYPVNKDSRPQNREGREPLDAVEHVIGVGLVFPDATRQDTTVRYKSVALPLGDVDEMEELDAEALDTEAELDEVQV